MKTITRIMIVVALATAASAVLVLKRTRDSEPQVVAAVSTTKLPKLLDLGADKCIPCKMMAPILEELTKEYAGRMAVEFIDVWKNPDAAKQYGVEIIPTQIFYDAEGKELFRHTGFFGKEDILAQWRRLGVDVAEGSFSAGK